MTKPTKILILFILTIFLLISFLTYLYFTNKKTPNASTTITQEDLTKNESNTIIYTYDERIERGDYYANNAFLSLAVNEYTKASQIHPEQAEPYFKLGKTHLLLNNFDKATLNFNKAKELNPNQDEINLYIARNFIKQNKFTEAKSVLISSDQTNPEILYLSSLLDLSENKNTEANNKLNQILSLSPEVKLQEKITQVLNSYTEYSLFKGGKEIHLRTLLAKNLNQLEEYEISLNILKEVLKEKNDYRDAWILTGYAYLNLEKYDFALDSFRKAYDLDSEKPETQYFLGITYFELNQIEDALTYLNISLKNGFEPQIQVKQKLADIYLEKKDYNKAANLYEEILSLNNNDTNTFIRPIWINIEFLNNPDKALEIAQKAYKAHPEDAMTYNLLAWAHIGKQEFIKAEELLIKATEKDPNLQAAWYNLGRTYQGMNNTEKALTSFQKAYELGKDTSIGNLAAKEYNTLYSQ